LDREVGEFILKTRTKYNNSVQST